MRVVNVVAVLWLGLPALPVLAEGADELAFAGAAIAAHPDDEKSYDAYALAAFRAHRWDEAIASLKGGLARPGLSRWAEGYYKLAFAYRQKQSWNDAVAASQKASALAPDRADTYYGWAVAADKGGDLATARFAYLHYADLERSPQKQRFVEQAKKRAQEIVLPVAVAPVVVAPPVAIPDDAPSLRATAAELLGAGHYDEAAVVYQKAIAADPANPDAYAGLGRAYLRLRRYRDALAPLRAATEHDRRFAPAWYDLAHASRRAGEKAEAVAAFRRYIELRPDDADPYYGLGQTLKALGDASGALTALRSYVTRERRPAQQSWVAKARRDIEALEALGRTGRRSVPGGDVLAVGAEDEILAAELAGDDGPMRNGSVAAEWRVPDLKDPFPTMELAGMPLRDLRDPLPRSTEGLLNPFDPTSAPDLRNPWQEERLTQFMPVDGDGARTAPSPVASQGDDRILGRYEAAIVDYDRALRRATRLGPSDLGAQQEVVRTRRLLSGARKAYRVAR